jgi:hypothetical protein
MIKNLIGLLVILSISFGVGNALAVEWEELKGEHFIVYFNFSEQGTLARGEKIDPGRSRTTDFAKEVLHKAELYYQRIALDLGYPRYSEFWTWDKRVKVYIYPDQTSYLKASGQPGWSSGMADYNKKEILSYNLSKGFLDSILPHEIAHLIFRDFIGFKSDIPLWLDEGVAQWEESEKREKIKSMVRELYSRDSLLSIRDMMKLDVRNIKEIDRLHIRSIITKKGARGILFLSGENLLNTYYLQAVSLVGFLIEKYGSADFADFCRSLRDGKTVEQALTSVYPNYIHSLEDFEENWRKYLQFQYNHYEGG